NIIINYVSIKSPETHCLSGKLSRHYFKKAKGLKSKHHCLIDSPLMQNKSLVQKNILFETMTDKDRKRKLEKIEEMGNDTKKNENDATKTAPMDLTESTTRSEE